MGTGENNEVSIQQHQVEVKVDEKDAKEKEAEAVINCDQFFHVKLVLIVTQPSLRHDRSPSSSPRRINNTGCDFRFQELVVGSIRVKQQIWEIAYEETHFSILSFYMPGTQCAIIFYDVADRESFNRALAWIDEVKKRCRSAFILLAGSVVDPENEVREVEAEEAIAVANRIPEVIMAVEIDGATDDDLEELLNKAALKVVELQLVTRQLAQKREEESIKLLGGKKPKKVKVKKPIKNRAPCKVM